MTKEFTEFILGFGQNWPMASLLKKKRHINRQHNDQKKKDKQRYTKHTHKTKDPVTRTPLKTGGELMCSGRLSSSMKSFPFLCGHYTDYDYPFDIFKLFIKVPPSMICFKRKNLTQVKSV
jgi:hypothetical protein